MGIAPDAEESDAFLALGGWPSVLAKLFARQDIDTDAAATCLGEILDGRALPTHIAAFAAALRTKRETVEEMTGLSRAMRERAEKVHTSPDAIDTCGTGGDRAGTVNVSTMAALVAAGAGVPVCKHGGGASSSLSGSADVLRALGVAIDLGPTGVEACIAEVGIGFCFAPRFHPAMRHAGPIRRELGVATFFNFIGPLCNPAGVGRQVVGVGDASMAETMLGVLEANGSEHVLVVFGHDGLDELSLTSPSTILESKRDANGLSRTRSEFDPRSFGLSLVGFDELRGGDAEHNAGRARSLLGGEEGPQRDFLLVNAAAALLIAGRVEEIEDGLELAATVIDSGKATDALDCLIDVSQREAEHAS